jgi:sialate O-acetylesterase
MPVPVWGTARDGEKVTVRFDGQSASTTAAGGKWMVKLPPHKEGGPYELTVTGDNTVTLKNVLVGEVWICSGQSNMEFGFMGSANAAAEGPNANYPKLRMFTTPKVTAATPRSEAAGQWVECTPDTVKGFSAVGYFFGRDVHKALNVPVGMIHTSWGGTPAQAWTSIEGLRKDPELADHVKAAEKLQADYAKNAATYPAELAAYNEQKKQWDTEIGSAYATTLSAWNEEVKQAKAGGKPLPPKPQPAKPAPVPPRSPEGTSGTPTALYNSKIAPLVPYAIKGVIWYQGESNASRAREYRTLFPRMIADWREKWGQGDFPFLFVQIAPYVGQPPEIREAQFLTLSKSPNTAMAVITDVGEANNIHPKQKEPVGARLALAARALAYGEKIEYSGPLFESAKFDGNRAIVRFQHTGSGLQAKDGPLKGFTVAGADKKFVPATAEIVGDTVVVSAPEVTAPVAVRYGWATVPDVNLYNKEGLPASPFRSDVE